jgi:glycosyltransferase involved in cell wall biosynthesis
VLHVVPALQGGGAERVLLTLVTGLTDMTHRVAVCRDGVLDSLVPPGVSMRTAECEVSLTHVMRTFKPHVVHTWLDDSLLLAALPAAQLGIPVVHRIYHTPSVDRPHEPQGAGYDERVSGVLGAIAQVVALSVTAADDAAAFYRIDRPRVIYNGLPLAGQRGAGHSPIVKEPGRFVILNVGRLVSQKGQSFLIDAFSRIARKYPQADLWIAGEGALEKTLKTQAIELGVADRVKFAGFQEDVAALHEAADLFAFPSVSEGFGNALAEALLAGLPVVASDLPVIRTEVLGGRPAAALVPAGDAAAFAAALDWLIPDAVGRAALGRAARDAGARFERSRMFDEYRQLYMEVVERPYESAVRADARGADSKRSVWSDSTVSSR